MQGLDRRLLVALLLLCSLSSSLPKVQGIAQAVKTECGPNCALISTDGTDPTAPPFFLMAVLNDSISDIVLTAPRYQASCRSNWLSLLELHKSLTEFGVCKQPRPEFSVRSVLEQVLSMLDQVAAAVCTLPNSLQSAL
jgi:hypothetical protein